MIDALVVYYVTALQLQVYLLLIIFENVLSIHFTVPYNISLYRNTKVMYVYIP